MNIQNETAYGGTRWSLSFSYEGQFLFFAEGNQAVALHAQTLAPAFTVESKWKWTSAVIVHPTRSLACIIGSLCWNAEDNECEMIFFDWEANSRRYATEFGCSVPRATFSKDGAFVRTWSVHLPDGEEKLFSTGGENCQSLSLHPNDRTLATSFSSQSNVEICISTSTIKLSHPKKLLTTC